MLSTLLSTLSTLLSPLQHCQHCQHHCHHVDCWEQFQLSDSPLRWRQWGSSATQNHRDNDVVDDVTYDNCHMSGPPHHCHHSQWLFQEQSSLDLELGLDVKCGMKFTCTILFCCQYSFCFSKWKIISSISVFCEEDTLLAFLQDFFLPALNFLLEQL